ncbi:MAG TPA: hypothetical protein VFB38_14035 [Chthonomonadaceae bacterium]|nr:hypothetical protein [Chthonomonadaceae bacterium]
MNKQIHPGIAVLAVLGVIGLAVAVMFQFADRKPPRLPTGPPSQMGAAKAAPAKTGGQMQNPRAIAWLAKHRKQAKPSPSPQHQAGAANAKDKSTE